MNRSVLITIIVAIVLIGAGGSYVLLSSGDDEEGKTYDVRVGYLNGDLHQLARVVATDEEINGGESLFSEYGLNISTPNPDGYSVGGDVMSAFDAGDIDIGFLGAPPAILRSLNVGTDIVIVAKVNSEGSALVVDEGVTNFTQLKGKTVASPGTSSIQHLMLLELAEQNGMNVKLKGTDGDENTVYFVAMLPSLMDAALDTDQVDAAIGWEPFMSEIILAGDGHALLWSSDVWEDHPCCVIAVSRTFAETNPDTVKMFLEAFIEANNIIDDAMEQGSGEKYSRIMDLAETFAGVDEDVVLDSMDHMTLDYHIGDGFEDYLIQFAQSYIDLNAIPASKLSDRGYANVTAYVDDLVQTQYLEEAE
ncbi:MAG: ABC transporter substrate-binding protein [Methanomassiliicoccales archaeon]|jgi:NitT/TauT family transport system substrate-binding protein